MLVNHHHLIQSNTPYLRDKEKPAASILINNSHDDDDDDEDDVTDFHQNKRAPNSFYIFKNIRQNEVNGHQLSFHQLKEEWNSMTNEQKAEFESQSKCLQFTIDIDNNKKSTFIPKIQLPTSNSNISMVIPNDHSVDNSPISMKEKDDYFSEYSDTHLHHHHHHPQHHHQHHHHQLSNLLILDNTTNHHYHPHSNIPTSPTFHSQNFHTATNNEPKLSYSAAAEAAALESLSFNNTTKLTTSQSTKRKYGIIPEKVKRPPNAYLLFNRDMRRQLHDQHLGLTSGEISKSISQKWKNLSQEQKDYYFKEESKLKQQHNNEHVNFIYQRRSKEEMKQAGKLKSKPSTATMPSPPPKKKNTVVSPLVDGKDPRGRKKKRSDESLPKHPMSGYLHFAKKMRPIMKREHPELRLVDISREIGVRWRSMTLNEQQPWIDISNQDKARYAKEMKERIHEDAQSLTSSGSGESKRKFSSISSLNTTSSSTTGLEELDSETIATVAQMVNPSNNI